MLFLRGVVLIECVCVGMSPTTAKGTPKAAFYLPLHLYILTLFSFARRRRSRRSTQQNTVDVMKRQHQRVVLSSSSSYRERSGHVENSKDLQVKSVGCMSGFFQFVFKYHNRHKTLTSGKKHEKVIVIPNIAVEPSHAATMSMPEKAGSIKDTKSTNCDKRCCVMAHETPRSPTIPPEIRLWSGSRGSPRAGTPPPTLVARLMGLSCEADGEVVKEAPDVAVEKRRNLLGALEKCEEDLKALKRIIDVVMQSEVGDRTLASEERPSPVSVLDRPRINSEKQNCSAVGITKTKAHQQWKRSGSAGQEDASTTNGAPDHNISLLERITDKPFSAASHLSNRERSGLAAVGATTLSRASKAMTESVEQVCRDITWGERREAGRIGVALHDHICRELIEETICELRSSQGQLPLDACRRRLVF